MDQGVYPVDDVPQNIFCVEVIIDNIWMYLRERVLLLSHYCGKCLSMSGVDSNVLLHLTVYVFHLNCFQDVPMSEVLAAEASSSQNSFHSSKAMYLAS